MDDLIQSIFDNLNILQTSLLFLKLGILHPFIIDHEEIINNIKNKTNYEISNSNIESVIDMSKTYAIGNVNESLIHIFLSIPYLSDNEYKVYEVVPLPKVIEKGLVYVSNIKKYFIISNDKKYYSEEMELNCHELNDMKWCKNTILKTTDSNPTCISDMFLYNSVSLCEYKNFPLSTTIYHKINNGLIITSTEIISINIICNQLFKNLTSFRGTRVFIVPKGCELHSPNFIYNQYKDFNYIFNLKPFIIELPKCCEQFNIPKQIELNNSMTLTNLQTIPDLKGQILKLKTNWDIMKSKMQTVPHFLNNYPSSWITLRFLIALAVSISVYFKRKKKKNAIY